MRFNALITSFAFILLVSPIARAGNNRTFDNVVVFGDSLSDVGNEYSTTLRMYSKATTNPGLLAVQHVAKGLGFDLQPSRVGGSDYAYGGSGVVTDADGSDPNIPTLTQQIKGYIANGTEVDQRTLYMIWGGSNDIYYHATKYGLGLLFPGQGETGAQALENVNAAATQELSLIHQLTAAGARYVVVFNVPNIGATPGAAADALLLPGSQSLLTAFSKSYNTILNDGLANSEANIVPVDTYSLLDTILADPKRFGIVNTTTPACTVSSAHDCDSNTLVTASAANTYLFADGGHPTSAVQAMLGEAVLSEIAAPEKISFLSESVLTAAAAQSNAVIQQMLADSLGSGSRFFATASYAHQHLGVGNDSPKLISDNVNLTLGVNWRANDVFSTGASVGLSRNIAHFREGGYQLNDYSVLTYVNLRSDDGLYVDAYIEGGRAYFGDINRVVPLGPALFIEHGNTDGSHLGLGLNGGWWFGNDKVKTGPYASIEWQSISVESYHEAGRDPLAMWFGNQQRHSLVESIGWRLRGHWIVGNTSFTPYATIEFNHDSKVTLDGVTSGVNSMGGTFTLPGYMPRRDWGSAELGLMRQFSMRISGWLSYNGRFGDASQRYSEINVGLKLAF